MREVDFQRKLLDLIKQAGGHGFKLSNRFQSGVLDLCVALPEVRTPGGALLYPAIPTRLIEVKVLKRRKDGQWEIGLTELQRSFMRKHQQAGGRAMWLGFRKGLDGEYYVSVGWDPDAQTTAGDKTASHFTIPRGKEWPIREIILG